jgi:predicted CXXCH cytochrome family protein
MFEHDPVNEDCAICHNPHGSTSDNLLVQAEPFVCMSCHPLHFHTSLEGYEGEFTVPLHPERSGVSTSEGFKPGMLTKCTQCHTEVHGSDLPAQSISDPNGLIR